MDEDEHAMEVIVPDDQLSLAIGKKGQNVRLASRLDGLEARRAQRVRGRGRGAARARVADRRSPGSATSRPSCSTRTASSRPRSWRRPTRRRSARSTASGRSGRDGILAAAREHVAQQQARGRGGRGGSRGGSRGRRGGGGRGDRRDGAAGRAAPADEEGRG